MNDDLKTSQNGLEFISKWEACILKPYKDIAGLRTIGVGHLILPNENFPDGMSIAHEKALEILGVDVGKCEAAIKNGIKVTLNQNQFDALVSFGFNCGVGVYTKSGVADVLKTGNYDSVPSQMLKWNKAKVSGILQPVSGLTARRQSEGQLFMKKINGNEASPDAFVAWTKTSLAEAQTILKKIGLYTKSIDGIWGPGTKLAIEKFESNIGVALSDSSKGVTVEVLNELKKSA